MSPANPVAIGDERREPPGVLPGGSRLSRLVPPKAYCGCVPGEAGAWAGETSLNQSSPGA
jgi:hypothetical protein